mmetsp:Transcript_18755/g.31926  ORF Transcript_18755/g.31926 Transcript_18755/m.31926 type:complete len:241 (+) Transcript_18755:101-823(+)
MAPPMYTRDEAARSAAGAQFHAPLSKRATTAEVTTPSVVTTMLESSTLAVCGARFPISFIFTTPVSPSNATPAFAAITRSAKLDGKLPEGVTLQAVSPARATASYSYAPKSAKIPFVAASKPAKVVALICHWAGTKALMASKSAFAKFAAYSTQRGLESVPPAATTRIAPFIASAGIPAAVPSFVPGAPPIESAETPSENTHMEFVSRFCSYADASTDGRPSSVPTNITTRTSLAASRLT